MSNVFLISDAARKVAVESHVLRYWEEELGLPIKRNELGHRYYTDEDILRFQEIRDLKDKGLQLKAIKIVLKNGKLDMLGSVKEVPKETAKKEDSELLSKTQLMKREDTVPYPESREEKAARLQWLLQQLFRDALQENNAKLCKEIKESLVKELDYQFRMQDEREEERSAEKLKRDEEHFKKIDELLRKKRGLFKKRKS